MMVILIWRRREVRETGGGRGIRKKRNLTLETILNICSSLGESKWIVEEEEEEEREEGGNTEGKERRLTWLEFLK
ncbi:hypothetical protein TWF506_001993 [Arthrobotrys conoides]|uniref:Uncharacterized protein n=1 Tax=Arthrobotrys conoides TaxID=74498 RepID=A0AAN8RYJ2_9PEZI